MVRRFIAHRAPAPKTVTPLTMKTAALAPRADPAAARPASTPATGEIGGPEGPEPTRYGDWERKGICVDF